MAFTTNLPPNTIIDAFATYDWNERVITSNTIDSSWYSFDVGISETNLGKPPKQSFREKVFGKKIDIRKLNKSLI